MRRNRSFRSTVTIGNRGSQGIVPTQRKRRIPADAVGNIRHRRSSLLVAFADERTPVRTGTAHGTRRIAVGDICDIDDACKAGHLRVSTAAHGRRGITVPEVAVLDKTAETAAVGTLGRHAAAGHITVGDMVILNADKAAAVGAAGHGSAFHVALRCDDIVATEVGIALLTDKTAHISTCIGDEGRILDGTAVERDTRHSQAAEAATLGLSAGILRHRTRRIETIGEAGILGRSHKAAHVLTAGHITAGSAVRIGRGAGRIARKTTGIFRGIADHRRAGTIRIGSCHERIPDEAAYVGAHRGDRRARQHLTVFKGRAGITGTTDETAHILERGLRRHDGRLDRTAGESHPRIGASDKTACRQFIARGGVVLIDRYIRHVAIDKADRHFIFIVPGDVRISGKAADMTAGARDRSVLHGAILYATGGTDVSGKAAGETSAGDRRVFDNNIFARGGKTRRAQESGHGTLLGRSANDGSVKSDIADGTIEDPGKTGIGGAGRKAADGITAAIKVDGLVETVAVIDGRPLDAGSIDIGRHLEPVFERSLVGGSLGVPVEFHHIFKMALVCDEVRVGGSTGTARKIPILCRLLWHQLRTWLQLLFALGFFFLRTGSKH